VNALKILTFIFMTHTDTFLDAGKGLQAVLPERLRIRSVEFRDYR
jgi:hypothetical protein